MLASKLRMRHVIAALPMTALTAGPAHPQEPSETVRESLDDAVRDQRQRSRIQKRGRSKPLTFDAILRAPDDVELNLAYARQQIAAGDLKEAAATLERILLLDSSQNEIRALYGLVLYRLGLLERAKFELETALASNALSDAAASSAEATLGRIRRAGRRFRGRLSLTAGAEFDDNRNQAPSSGSILFLDTPLPAATAREADFAYITSAQASFTRKVGGQAGHALVGDALFFRSNKVEVDNLDLNATAATFGAALRFDRLTVTPTARFSHLWLDGQDFLQTRGGALHVKMQWKSDFKTYFNFRAEDEDFRVLTSTTTDVNGETIVTQDIASALREGKRLTARSGWEWRVTPTQSLRVEGLYMDKNATVGFESFERYGVNAQYGKLFKGGAFALATGWIETTRYDDADPFVSTTRRRETLYRGRAAVGAPLSRLAPMMKLPREAQNINVVAQYEYERVQSNLLNFDYGAHRVNLLLTKTIPF